MIRPVTVGASIGIVFVAAQFASASDMTLVRSSRAVTAAEAAGGAPADGMVHDFYATSNADLITLLANVNVPVYRHPYADDHSAPDPQLVTMYPAVGANSFFRFPSSTIVLGGGLNGIGPEIVWADLSNDGPQTNFLFGRLTTNQVGSFSGMFAIRGGATYLEVPFSFSLPGSSGPLSEQLSVSGTEPPLPEYVPPPTPPVEEIPFIPIEPWPVVETATLPLGGPVPAWAVRKQTTTTRLSKITKPTAADSWTAAVPEPAAWMLGAIALPLLPRRRSGKHRGPTRAE